MLCPNCRRENQAGNLFCIFCGTPLREPESIPPVANASGIPDADQQSLRDELRRLRETIAQMNNRLITLERGQRVAPIPQTAPMPTPEVVYVEPAIVTPQEPAVPHSAEPRQPREWEQIFGGSWLARIGVVALIIGVAFFLKFAADRNWLNVIGWGVLGILSGLLLVWGGHYWRKKYPTFAQALSGGGVAIFYLSIFAAFTVFHFIPVLLALMLFLAIGVGAAFLASINNSMALAIIAMIGAFSAPYILREAGTNPYAGQGVYFMAYLVIVDIGVLLLASMRNWRWFTLFALISSLIAFGGWYEQFGEQAGLLTAEIGLTLIFLIFVAATTFFLIVRHRLSQGFDLALMVINAAGYYLISLSLMWADIRAWMGSFTLLLALFYGGFAYFNLSRNKEDRMPGYFALGTGIAFLLVAAPVQFEIKAWGTLVWAAEASVLMWLSLRARLPWLKIFSFIAITLVTVAIPVHEAKPWVAVIWAAEASVLMWLSFKLQAENLRIFSYITFGLLAIHLFFFDTPLDSETYRFLINGRVLAFLAGIAAIYLAAYLLTKEKKDNPELVIPATVFLVAANFFTVWMLSFELWSYFDNLRNTVLSGERIETSTGVIKNAQNLSTTGLWALYAVILLTIGIIRRGRVIRLTSLGLLAAAILKVIFFDIWTLEIIYRVIACVGLGVLLLVSAYLYQRYRRVIQGFLTK